ncbi:MAG: DNA polymerase III subunit gamma/tau [Desulfobacterales bacterium]
MSYLVLARKYRPQTFADVVEQEHVTRTLSNAISAGRVAHAILFSGPRGTGKTTIARILAKAMNCEHGPTPAPCNQCRSCTEITSGSAADVFEIDGASNNGVDHIRDLRENIRYMPAHSRYKIYIIDEVHMLSTAAFNALLKTLEEPPAHILFFFATTEPHKIPITILSRCQRHDLRRIDLDDICNHMDALCKKEGISITRESLGIIARESGGSMRDALSLLDQVMSGSPEGISHEQVLDLLGVVDRKILFEMSAAVLRSDLPEILGIIEDIYDQGHNIKELYASLAEHFRNLLVVRMGRKVDKLVDVPSHEIALMSEQVKDVSEVFLSQILDALCKEESAIRYSTQPRLAMEMAFIRVFQIRPALPIETLIEKLDKLSKGVYDGPADFPRPEPAVAAVRESVSYRVAFPKPQETKPRDAEKRTGPSPVPESPVPKVQETEPRKAETSAVPEVPAPAETQAEEKSDAEESAVKAVYQADEPLEKTWEKLRGILAARSPSLCSCLGKCSLKDLAQDTVELETEGNGFQQKQIEKNLDAIRDACEQFFGRKMNVSVSAGVAQTNNKQEEVSRVQRVRQEAVNHPLIAAALEIFDGRLVDVKIL